MLFSILIANYNNSRYLETALSSVLDQSYINWEVILVDDYSTDDFEKVVNTYKSESRIKVFQNEKNQGCGYTKRRCAELASGEISGFLDPDDALHPEAIETMIAAHISKPNCSLIHSTHYVCDDSLTVKRVAEYPRPLPDNTPYLSVSDGRVHHFATYKTSAYSNTIGISATNKKAVDQDLYYKLEEEGEIHFIDKPLYYYRIHTGGISTTGKEAEATLCHYKIIEEACSRRIEKLKSERSPDSAYWIRLYRTKYHKTKIFHSFKSKSYLNFAYNLALFPFVGGMDNIISYLKKLPVEGYSLIRKSFFHDYKIKVD
ncbi:MAG: glycosyltransferase [Gloeobacteraceae cyanobacterium ES-bin-316]|nr:glycosyltransferase [Ferruginibacter sp.]